MADPCWACLPAQGSFLLAVLILLSSLAPSPQSTALAPWQLPPGTPISPGPSPHHKYKGSPQGHHGYL